MDQGRISDGVKVASPSQAGLAPLVGTPAGRAAGQPEGTAWAASLFASPSSTAMSSTPSKDGTTPSSWLSPLLQQVPIALSSVYPATMNSVRSLLDRRETACVCIAVLQTAECEWRTWACSVQQGLMVATENQIFLAEL